MSLQEEAHEGIQEALTGWPQRAHWQVTAFYQPERETFVLKFKHRTPAGDWEWLVDREHPDSWPFVPEDVATGVRHEVRAVVLHWLRHFSEAHGWPLPPR